MRKRFVTFLSILAILTWIVSSLPAAAVQVPISDGPAPAIPGSSGRLIVQLEDEALATHWRQGLRAAGDSESARLDVNSAEAREYLNLLAQRQEAFKATLAREFPDARVESSQDSQGQSRQLAYRVSFNGMTLQVPDTSATTIRQLEKLPGVKAVFPDTRYEQDMYASLPLIDAPALWTQLGGQTNAGRGVKIASIDSGIYAPNPCFSADNGTPKDFSDDFAYPAGFPKGDDRYTNGKVIVARAYFRAWDAPSTGDETPWPGPAGSSHGTHTSGSMACNADTTATFLGHEEVISGVAPGAWLMSYRVFYPTASLFSGSAFAAEILLAIEDAVTDGADVINNSWGGYPGTMPAAVPEVQALEAAWDAGVFISCSAGNDGPAAGSTSHTPGGSPKLMSVGWSSTSGTLASGRFYISAPEPVPDNLKNFAFSTASFGEPLAPGQIFGPYDFLPAGVADPNNAAGCSAWPAGTFTGKAAVIVRGTCEFGVKVLYAEQAGAEFVVVHNHAAGGDALINMGPGAVGDQATIPSVFIGYTDGQAVLNWYATHGTAAQFTLNTQAFQSGSVPDVMSFSSARGPSFGRYLRPDVTAPGVNILSAGYDPAVSGTDQHAGFGQASGSSMASPHVAGSAALVVQAHPNWTPDQIKSALMSTATTEGVFNDAARTDPAGVLDYGAGRIDLSLAADPGLTFEPPSISFGPVTAPYTQTATVHIQEAAGLSATYDVSVQADDGIALAPTVSSISVTPNGMTHLTLNLTVPAGTEPGDYTGAIMLAHGTHHAHIPFWVRVNAPMSGAADVLLLDNDGSTTLGTNDYTIFYTSTLEALGVTYDYYDADAHYDSDPTIPPAEVLNQYKTIIIWTGDNYQPDGTFTVATPFTEIDQFILGDYLDSGGSILATGQDLAAVTDATGGADPTWERSRFYHGYLGARFLQDSIFDPQSEGFLPPAPGVLGMAGSPLDGLKLDISGSDPITTSVEGEDVIIGWTDGAQNQLFVDQIAAGGSLDDPALDANQPLMVALGGSPVSDQDDVPMPAGPVGVLAVARSDEPSLEEPLSRLAYRAVYLGFGFEGINDSTGFNTRAELMGALLGWLTDDLTVQLPTARGKANDILSLEAQVTSSAGADSLRFRWDFGDDSPLGESNSAKVSHLYTQPGAYTVKVEVTDVLGHTALGQGTVTIDNQLWRKSFSPLLTSGYTAPKKIMLMHTNDFHGNLQPDSSGRGGSAYISGVINGVRAKAQEPNVVLMDAGDSYLGAKPISQLLLGESTIDIYNRLSYDLSTYGNHEFDKGQTLLISRTLQSNYPWVSANIVISGTEWEHPSWSPPYITMTVGTPDNRVVLGVIGLTTDEAPLVTLKGTTDGLVFKDPTATLLHYYDEVKAQSDALIVLSHIGTDDSSGYKGLKTIAREMNAAGKPIDIYIGGHQHQSLFTPTRVGGSAIIQAGHSGRWIGKANLSINTVTKKITLDAYELVTVTNKMTADTAIAERVAYWDSLVQPVISQPVGTTNVSLVRDYNNESSMGNLVADSLRWKADQYDDGAVNGSVQIGFTNAGGLRDDIRIPDGATLPYSLTWGSTFNVLPFANTMFMMDLTGAQIQTLLNQGASLFKGILQSSGVTWKWYNNCRCATPTTWGATDIMVNGEPLDPAHTYRIVTNDFLAGGQDGFVTFAAGANRVNTYYDMQEGLNDYIRWYNSTVGPIDHAVEGRITYYTP